jgi:hypothetical protein
MRLILPLLLAGCTVPADEPGEPVPPLDRPGDTQDSGDPLVTDSGDTGLVDDALPPPLIDQNAPAHVALATFALG